MWSPKLHRAALLLNCPIKALSFTLPSEKLDLHSDTKLYLPKKEFHHIFKTLQRHQSQIAVGIKLAISPLNPQKHQTKFYSRLNFDKSTTNSKSKLLISCLYVTHMKYRATKIPYVIWGVVSCCSRRKCSTLLHTLEGSEHYLRTSHLDLFLKTCCARLNNSGRKRHKIVLKVWLFSYIHANKLFFYQNPNCELEGDSFRHVINAWNSGELKQPFCLLAYC